MCGGTLSQTGFDPRWTSLFHFVICSGTNLRLRRLVPIFYGIFELAGVQAQETKNNGYKKISFVILAF
jgi:hypothetical protein